MEESTNRKRVTSFFGADNDIGKSENSGKNLDNTIKRLYVEINTLNGNIKDKDQVIKRQSEKIDAIESDLEKANLKINSLKDENQLLKKLDASRLKAIGRLRSEIDSLKELDVYRLKDVEVLKGELDSLKNQIDATAQNNVEPKKEVGVNLPKLAPVLSQKVSVKSNPKTINHIGSKKKLAVITTFFNPANYINLRYNYLKFSEEIKKQADLFPIELSFNGEFFIKDSNVIRINGSKENVLWQKERLLQIALDNLPPEYDNVAWLDCDILFENPNWAQEINDKLEEYRVVQVYERAKRLDGDGNIGLTSTGIIKKNKEDGRIYDDIRGTTGFGWAIRRDVIDKVKFIDTQIIGGADAIMYFAFHGINGTRIHAQMTPGWQEAIKPWCDRAYDEVKGSVGYVSGEIIHLYHGKPVKRDYGDRHDPLRKYNFDPRKHLELTDEGIWRFTLPQLNTELKKYFVSRDEDDNVLRVNSYFDNVYVLNLDRRPDRLESVKKELDFFGIKFERFSAIDGNNISDFEYDFDKFVAGRGMIENKYALACLRSHIEIIKDAKRKGYKRILIFEDDIVLDPDFMVYFQNIKKIPNWKLLYLGATQYDWGVEFVDNFYYSKQSLGTFAFAADSSIYDQILEGNEEDLSVDNLLSKVQKENYKSCYTYYPNICVPDVSDSDIRGSRDQEVHSKKMRWNHFLSKDEILKANQSPFRFSTIMISRLSDYPGSRSNPVMKFHRAIESWELQNWANKELVIVSDGCEITNNEWRKRWAWNTNIKLVSAPKSEWKWPGELRGLGIEAATGDWINYLDSDDVFAPDYLTSLAGIIQKNPDREVFFNQSIATAIEELPKPNTDVSIFRKSSIIREDEMGTVRTPSQTLHWVARKGNSTSFATHTMIHKPQFKHWKGSDSRGEDIIFSNELKGKGMTFTHHGYIICHHQFLDL